MKKFNVFSMSVLIISSLCLTVNSQEQAITIDNTKLYSEDLMKKNALKALKKNDYKKVIFLYSKLLSKFPHNDFYLIGLADAMYLDKDYTGAYQKYNDIVKNSYNPEYVKQSNSRIKEIDKILKELKKKPVVKKKTDIEPKLVLFKEDDTDNYLCNPSDPTIFTDENKNTFRRWEKEDFPLKIYIPKVPEDFDVPDSNRYIEWTKHSLQRWVDKLPQLFKYVYVDSPENANVIVNWNNYFKDESWGRAQMPLWNAEKKRRISIVNLAVRAKLSNAEVFFSEAEFLQIATHETGHTMGLAHSYKAFGNDDIMFPAYRSTIPGSEPDITQRDINSLVRLYSLNNENNYKCE